MRVVNGVGTDTVGKNDEESRTSTYVMREQNDYCLTEQGNTGQVVQCGEDKLRLSSSNVSRHHSGHNGPWG